MAKKNGNGGKPAADANEALLRAVQSGFDMLRDELKAGFSKVNDRLDQIVENTGAHWRNHEARLRALEKKLGMDH